MREFSTPLALTIPTTGNLTDESATDTFAGFRTDAERAGIGSTTAVGRTDAASGEVTIDVLEARSSSSVDVAEGGDDAGSGSRARRRAQNREESEMEKSGAVPGSMRRRT